MRIEVRDSKAGARPLCVVYIPLRSKHVIFFEQGVVLGACGVCIQRAGEALLFDAQLIEQVVLEGGWQRALLLFCDRHTSAAWSAVSWLISRHQPQQVLFK